MQRWFVIFCAATAAASLAGGTVHGFFADNKALWRVVLIALGVVSAAAWAIGARPALCRSDRAFITAAALAELVAYSLLVVFVTDAFSVAIANYLPSTLFLIVAFFASHRAPGRGTCRARIRRAGAHARRRRVQQARVALHPAYFNHNAVYHLLQAIALFLIFRAAMFVSPLVSSPLVPSPSP